ncbi:MAG TPA: hypothetical protein VMV57_13230 [Terracidiphilus sp.]|nr:hypothetical protein [Terracidiphilus sp.]
MASGSVEQESLLRFDCDGPAFPHSYLNYALKAENYMQTVNYCADESYLVVELDMVWGELGKIAVAPFFASLCRDRLSAN